VISAGGGEIADPGMSAAERTTIPSALRDDVDRRRAATMRLMTERAGAVTGGRSTMAIDCRLAVARDELRTARTAEPVMTVGANNRPDLPETD